VEAVTALAGHRQDDSVDHVLQVTMRAVRHLTGAAAALVMLDDEGRLERFLTDGADGCTRESLVRRDVLDEVAGRLAALGRPLGPGDVDGRAGRTLAALAPRGFLALPLGADVRAVLLLLEPPGDGVAAVALLATLAGAALADVRRFGELRASRDELRRLLVEALGSRERELGETSHRLHEGICQHLAAANAHLQALDPLLDGGIPAARARLRDARALLNQTLGELRELAQQLHPRVLEDFGYLQALRWYAARLRRESGVSLALEVEGAEGRLPVDVEGALYRATEEAIVAFTRARGDVRVRVRRAPAAIEVEISGSRPPALELGVIRERLRPFGGAVELCANGAAPVAVAVRLSAPLD
jgi:hypothetical protein